MVNLINTYVNLVDIITMKITTAIQFPKNIQVTWMVVLLQELRRALGVSFMLSSDFRQGYFTPRMRSITLRSSYQWITLNLIGNIVSFSDYCRVNTNMFEIAAHFILKLNGIQVQIQILGRKFTSCTTNIINHFSCLFWNRDRMMGTDVALSVVYNLVSHRMHCDSPTEVAVDHRRWRDWLRALSN